MHRRRVQQRTINTFEQMVSGTIADPDSELKIYREDSRTPICALTRTLFLRVLEMDTMATSIPTIEQSLRSAENYPQPLTTMLDGTTAQTTKDAPDVPKLRTRFARPTRQLSRRRDLQAGSGPYTFAKMDQLLVAGPEPILGTYNLLTADVDGNEPSASRIMRNGVA